MSAADRRKAAFDAHRAFLANVTGLNFSPPFLDATKGVVFRLFAIVAPDGRSKWLVLDSIVSERADLPK